MSKQWIFSVFMCLVSSYIGGFETPPATILNRLRSDQAIIRWKKPGETKQSILELHLFNQNTTLRLELVQNRDLIHPKFITRVVQNGSSSVHKQGEDPIGNGSVTDPFPSELRPTSYTVSECIHQGSVSGLEGSRVLLTGCSFIYRGYIFHNGKSWKIQFRKRGSTGRFIHTIRRVRWEGLNKPSYCPVDDTTHKVWSQEHLEEKQHHGRHRRSSDVKLLELFVVFSHNMYTKHMSNDKKNAEFYATSMSAHLDTFYKFDIGVRIALVGVEVWETRDEITMVTDAKQLLGSFIDYSKTLLTGFKYDLVTLVTDENFDYNIAGMAHVDVMCSPLSAAVIKHFSATADPYLKSAVSLAHEIGHALGLVHDTAKCACGDRTGKCIMSADTSSDPQSFSQCSIDALSKMFREGGASCLYDAPPHVYGGPVCGNGVKEQGEVCDCGGIADCVKDVCCEYGCKLKSNAQCNSGGCCQNCKIVSAGMICRSKQNECDLEEFCDGRRPECPDNLHLPDMGKCGPATSSGFCYKGKCRHAQAQCEYLWGAGSKAAYGSCYQSNVQGTVTGNCGANRSPGSVSYKKCEQKNAMCGMIQCDTHRSSPLVGVSRQIINTTIGPHRCISVAIDLGDDVPDPGLVDDGSPCLHIDPPDRLPGVCLSGECIVLQTVKKTTCPVGSGGLECSNKGTCTNDGSCFCDDGYTGLNCSQLGGVTRIRPSTTPTTTLSTPSTPTSSLSAHTVTTPSTTTLSPSTSISSLLPGTPSSSAASLPTPSHTGTQSVSTTAPGRSTPTPTEQPPKDHLVEIICGILGGLTGLAALFIVLCWCRRPKVLWKWLDDKFEKNSTSPQTKPSTAWGENTGQNQTKYPLSPHNQIGPGQGNTKPSVISVPTTGGHPGNGHMPGHLIIPVRPGAGLYPTTPGKPVAGHFNGHGSGHSQGQGHSGSHSGHSQGQGHSGSHGGHSQGHGHSNGNGGRHSYGGMTGHGNGNHGRGRGYTRVLSNRPWRFSTSDYGSQESMESIRLDYDTGPTMDALPGEVKMTPTRRFSSIN